MSNQVRLDAIFNRPKRPPLTEAQIEAYRALIKDPAWYKKPLNSFRRQLERRLERVTKDE